MKASKVKTSIVPKFSTEQEESKWWASPAGRAFLKDQPRVAGQRTGSPLVDKLARTKSVQIALRLPTPDLARAREIAERKGIGYQTLLKMLVHEGLARASSKR